MHIILNVVPLRRINPINTIHCLFDLGSKAYAELMLQFGAHLQHIQSMRTVAEFLFQQHELAKVLAFFLARLCLAVMAEVAEHASVAHTATHRCVCESACFAQTLRMQH